MSPYLFFPGLLPALDALLDAQPAHLFHEKKDLVAPRADVVADLLQLQLRKVLQHLHHILDVVFKQGCNP